MNRLIRLLTDLRFWGPVYLLAVTALLFTYFKGWVYDDPFITYRFAENIASGLGFVYNPGEPVLSTTTPLFALVLALAALAGFDIPTTANFLGAASLAAGGLLFWTISRQLAADPARATSGTFFLGAAGLLLYPTFPLLVSTLGSETPLVLALCLGSIAAYLGRRFLLTGILIGLSLLTRGDALILAGALALDWFIIRRTSTREIPWRAPAAALAVVFPWLVYGWITFGSPLPVTMDVKRAQGLLEGSVAFTPGLLNLVAGYLRIPTYWLSAILALAGFYFSIRVRDSRLLFLTWALLYTAAFATLGLTSYFWYYAPLIPGLIAGIGTGADGVFKLLRAAKQPYRAAPLIAAILFLFYGQAANLSLLRQIPDNRYEIYRAIGSWFSENTPKNTKIATLEVGIIGYYSRPRPMVDFGGLIRPEVAEQFYQGYTFSQSALWTAERFQPDYIVLTQSQYRELLQKYVSVRCVIATTFEGSDYAYPRSIDIYIC